jgi:hypothetical protein
MTVRLVCVALLAASCGGRERCDNGDDDDGDGFPDCADQDCAAECTEDCGNGADDDLDGLADCEDPACEPCTGPLPAEDCVNGADDDGDGSWDCDDVDCRTTCDADGDGFDSAAVGGNDCDDTDFDVHPGADEVPYDGQDDDCDPVTPDDDLDGDGFLLADDCADTSAATYPGAPEICGNGLVDDCDDPTAPPRETCFGTRSLATADASFLSTTPDNLVGWSVAVTGDADGDGDDDWVVGATGDGSKQTGAALLVESAPGAAITSDAIVKWVGPGELEETGFSVAAAGTLDGGLVHDNLLIGAPYADPNDNDSGVVYLVRTTVTSDPYGNTLLVDLVAPIPTIPGEAQGDLAGWSVAGGGDVVDLPVPDDDGTDAVIGAPNGAGGRGIAYLIAAPVDSQAPPELAEISVRYAGDAVGDAAGCAVAIAGDPSGDGAADVLVGACEAGGTGAAGLFTTHLGERTISDADGLLAGAAAGDDMGHAVAGAGDVNDDGFDDFLIGAPGAYAGAGFAAGVFGADLAPVLVPAVQLLGTAPGDAAGTAVSAAGDVNGDGFDDIAVGAPYSDLTAEDAGAAYLVWGANDLLGVVELDTAPVVLTGTVLHAHAGASLAGSPGDATFDADSDGFSDVVVGAPYLDGHAPDGGGAYLLTFGL